MKGRLWATLALLVASSAALAGCIEGFESFSSENKGITAQEDRDLADNAASAWNPSSFLIGAVSIETFDARLGVPSDVDLGDGYAPFWYYAYGIPDSDETRLLRVTADGRVTVEEQLPLILRDLDFEIVPLTKWQINSDAAINAIRGVAPFTDVLLGANLSIVEGVGYFPQTQEDLEQGSYWGIAAMSDKGFAVASVNAVTGEVKVHEVDPSVTFDAPLAPAFTPLPPPVVITDEGSLSNSELQKSYEFKAGDNMEVMLDIQMISRDYATEYLRWWIEDEEGAEVTWGNLGRNTLMAGDSDERTYDIELEEAGTYTFFLRSDTGIDGITGAAHLGNIEFAFKLVAGYDLEDLEM